MTGTGMYDLDMPWDVTVHIYENINFFEEVNGTLIMRYFPYYA
jgi:hypothetical protein